MSSVWRTLAAGLLLSLLLLGGVGAATVQYVYDDLGRLVTVIDGNGMATVYTYDPAGNLTSVTRGGDQLAITAFVPGQGKAGDTVTLYGVLSACPASRFDFRKACFSTD